MRYTIWTYQEAGFGHGWKTAPSDELPEGAEVVGAFDIITADKKTVYALDNSAGTH
jgi:hypothetical protein